MQRTGLIAGVVLLVVAFVAFNVTSTRVLRGAKLDITDGRQYTLTEGSRRIARSPVEPITLTLYYSARLAQGIPDVQGYAQRVRELLEEYASTSGGKVRLEIVEPEPFSEQEDAAVAAGIRGIPVGAGGEQLYFGLSGRNSVDGRQSIPFFDPQRERFLEYDLSKLISGLATVRPRTVVGYISPLQLEGGFMVNPRTRQPEPTRQWQVFDELKQALGHTEQTKTVRKLDPATLTTIPDDINVLLVVHPKQLPEAALYAIDQYALAGRPLMVFVDPLCEADTDGTPWQPVEQKASDLSRLLGAWGVEVPAGLVVGDQDLALRVVDTSRGTQEAIPFVLWMGLREAQLDRDDGVVGPLRLVNVASSGHIVPISAPEGDGGPRATITPLLKTTDGASTMAVQAVGQPPDVRKLFAEFAPGKEALTIAARLGGTVKTAFPDGPPKNPDGQPVAEASAQIRQSAQPLRVMLFADVDMLSDRMWASVQNVLGMRMVNKVADNSDLLLGAVDDVAGSSDLAQVRARPTGVRPFTKVEDIRRLAEQKYQREEFDLSRKLEEAQNRIRELENQQGAGGGGLVLSPEQRAEIEKFRGQMLETRKRLREVRLELNRDVEGLGTTLKVMNTLAMPLGVIGAGIIIWIIRANRRKSA